MHKDWCGKTCAKCKSPCNLDKSMPCSPDCKKLGQIGEVSYETCKDCDALQEQLLDNP